MFTSHSFFDEARQLASACREKFFAMNPDVEMVVTDNPIHVGWLGGYRSILHDSGPYSQILLANRQGVALVTGASDAAAALEVITDPQRIFRYGNFYVYQRGSLTGYQSLPPAKPSQKEALQAALDAIGANAKEVACELRHPETLAHLSRYFGEGRLREATELFRRARAVKLPGEIRLLRYASQITDRALATAKEHIRPGVSELEIASLITAEIVKYGGIPKFIVVTSGERSSRVDAYARERRFEKTDLVRMDIGASVNGYCSDMARTVAVGSATQEAATRYRALQLGEQAELDLIRPGRCAADIFHEAVRTVRANGLPHYERNHCGHGIGLLAHEFPLLGPMSETLLEPGMVLCVETPYYETGWGGMMVEDTLLVTESGYELFTASSRELS